MSSVTSDRLSLGIASVDAELAGGFVRCGLHEAYAATDEDRAGLLAFLLLLGALKRQHDDVDDGRLIWIRDKSAPRLAGQLYGPGLVEIGVNPATLTLVELADGKAVLRAALDAVRDGAAGAVLIDLHGRQPLLDLTATRRLVLAAAETKTMILLGRSGAEPVPSAALTRWQVASAPSRASGGNALGSPAFELQLLRQRGGRGGLHIILEWDRDSSSFREKPTSAAALSGLVPAISFGGARVAHGKRAA